MTTSTMVSLNAAAVLVLLSGSAWAASKITCEDARSSDGLTWRDNCECSTYAASSTRMRVAMKEDLHERSPKKTEDETSNDGECKNNIAPSSSVKWSSRQECMEFAQADAVKRSDMLDAYIDRLKKTRDRYVVLSADEAATNKSGSCARGFVGPERETRFCMYQGLPGNLEDDGKARAAITVFADRIDDAQPERYRVTITFKGKKDKQLVKAFGPKIGGINTSSSGGFYGFWTVMPKKTKKWKKGEYLVEVIDRYDTDNVIRYHVTYE